MSHFRRVAISQKKFVDAVGVETKGLEAVSYGRDCVVPGAGELVIANVMGQEDRFREVDGVRVSNGLVGRIVWTASLLSTATVYYGTTHEGPVHEIDVDETATTHEIFIPNLNPDTEYVFYVEGVHPDGTRVQTERYYFETSTGTIVLDADEPYTIIALVEFFPVTTLDVSLQGASVFPEYQILTPPIIEPYASVVETDTFDVVAADTIVLSDFETEITVES